MSAEITAQVMQARTEGKPFWDFRYQMTRFDDLGSTIQRFEDYAKAEGLEVSDWQEENQHNRAEHTLKAAFVWNEAGKAAAVKAGYIFTPEPTEPSAEEQAEVERVLSESSQINNEQ